jgi:L-2-hydroxyglutarate oxidase LhgO
LDRVDGVVIGAGVVGLAVARALAISEQGRGREWLVLEAENAIGTGTSSRNSEVIHAGIYYPAGSLKARLCVEGRRLLYSYARDRGLPHSQCGKLIVATDSADLNSLVQIRQKAFDNGVNDLVWLDQQQANLLEPQLQCLAALHSPSTGIIDSHSLMLSLQADFENAGGLIAFNSRLVSAVCKPDGIVLQTQDGYEVLASCVVNSAGIDAPGLASKFSGLDPDKVPQAYYCKGNYFSLAGGRSPFSRLIYPVPQSAGLGVHLTIDLGGQAKFGPDVEWVDDPSRLSVDPRRCEGFYAEVRKYWPALPDGALEPAYAGIRPKINSANQPAGDFLIEGERRHGIKGLVNLFGIESPGLTSSLAIAQAVVQASGFT